MNFKYLTVPLLSLFLIGCGGGGSSSTPTSTPTSTNVAPTANAGDNLTVDEQTSVTLSGAGSDSDGTIASYKWTQTAGDSITLSDAISAALIFDSPTTPIELTLSFELEVTDDDGAVGIDTINVVVLPVNNLPIANAGDSQNIFERSDVTLTGSGEDNDGTITSYAWAQISGTPVDLELTSTESLIFTAPAMTTDETLIFKLTITDNEDGQASANVDVNVKAYKNISDISFTDMNFQSCVNDIASTEGWNDVEEVDDILCNYKNIDDINGVENFIYLTNLNLENNNIESITPLANLPSLVMLALSGNLITDISSISGLTSLNELWLPFNNISDITPLAALTTLNILYLRSNFIVDITSLTALKNLTELSLSFNDISAIPSFAENTSLELLYLTGNEITDITPLSAFPKLKTLYVNGNLISTISTLSDLKSLETLSLGSNSITNFSLLADLTLLKELFISYSSITDISFISGLTKLESLDLYGNSITDLSVLSGLSLLKELDIQYNDYVSLSSLSGLTSLTELKLGGYSSNNNLSAIAGLINLEYFELSNTSGEASDISFLAGMKKLKWLELNFNEISDISVLSSFSQLEEFYMYGGHSNGDYWSEPSVTDLSPLSDLTNLKTLDIRDHIYSNVAPLESILSLTSLNIDSPNVVCSDVDDLANALVNTSITRPSHCSAARTQKIQQQVSLSRKEMKMVRLKERFNLDSDLKAKLTKEKVLVSKHLEQ